MPGLSRRSLPRYNVQYRPLLSFRATCPNLSVCPDSPFHEAGTGRTQNVAPISAAFRLALTSSRTSAETRRPELARAVVGLTKNSAVICWPKGLRYNAVAQPHHYLGWCQLGITAAAECLGPLMQATAPRTSPCCSATSARTSTALNADGRRRDAPLSSATWCRHVTIKPEPAPRAAWQVSVGSCCYRSRIIA